MCRIWNFTFLADSQNNRGSFWVSYRNFWNWNTVRIVGVLFVDWNFYRKMCFLYVDNESTKFSLMKRTSENPTVDIMAKIFAETGLHGWTLFPTLLMPLLEATVTCWGVCNSVMFLVMLQFVLINFAGPFNKNWGDRLDSQNPWLKEVIAIQLEWTASAWVSYENNLQSLVTNAYLNSELFTIQTKVAFWL